MGHGQDPSLALADEEYPEDPIPRILSVALSEQSFKLLEQLAAMGLYGLDASEVAGRFIDAALERFVEPPRLRLPGCEGEER